MYLIFFVVSDASDQIGQIFVQYPFEITFQFIKSHIVFGRSILVVSDSEQYLWQVITNETV